MTSPQSHSQSFTSGASLWGPLRGYRKFLFILLLLVGTGQSLSYIAAWANGESLFRLTGASPLPLVFDTFMAHEYWSARYRIRWVSLESQSAEEVVLDAQAFNRVPGPHRLKMSYMALIAFSSVYPRSIWENALQTELCQTQASSVLGSALGIAPKEAKEFIIETQVRPGQGLSEKERIRERRVSCP